ncbi:MAG: hypothetical protein QM647_13875 [Asticcacaulis sp.]|uniref:hypothetical protein n=1 Tax=Asticcacaulis sp. TaxID=1872648 RepID=UPI0039E48100
MKTLILALLAGAHLFGQPAVTEELLTASASDFQTHAPPKPVDIRNLRLGAIEQGNGDQYLLCGEFRAGSGTEPSDWTPFATIKTSGYEQWLGDQATTICGRQHITWEQNHDLSADLKEKLGLK